MTSQPSTSLGKMVSLRMRLFSRSLGCLMDDLLTEAREQSPPHTQCMLFADDIAQHGDTLADLATQQELL